MAQIGSNSQAKAPAQTASRSGAQAAPSSRLFEIEAIIQSLGFILYNTIHSCWFSESDRIETIGDSFSVLATALERYPTLRFVIKDDLLKVNGESFAIADDRTRAFVRTLSALDVTNFTLSKGLSKDEFNEFVQLICRDRKEISDMGGFVEAVAKRNFKNISSKKMALMEVSEDEAVVGKRDIEALTARQKEEIEADVLSLLTDEQAKGDAKKVGSLRMATEDSGRMADLIMRAVDGKQANVGGDGGKKAVAGMVVECLDKAFAALLEDPFSRTQKGKAAIAGALKHLEKELLEKMKAPEETGERDVIASSVERMTERLKMDSIVQDYTRKLKSLESSETRILRFIKLQGLDRLHDADMQKRLTDEGVDVSGWHKLLALSGATATDGSDVEAEAAGAVRKLSEILSRLEDRGAGAGQRTDEESARQIEGGLKDASAQIEILAQTANQRINSLIQDLQTDIGTVDAMEEEARRQGRGPRMSRREIVRVLADIVRELGQPLSVIRCSIDIIKTKNLGEVTTAQANILDLALENVVRIGALIDNIERISGLPVGAVPADGVRKTAEG